MRTKGRNPDAEATVDAKAVRYGLPEAQLNLAHAVVHLVPTPKSNRVTTACAAHEAAGRSSKRVRPRHTCG
ncbi:MAG: hypothetical protein KTU85_12445 [Acidimicrobiia bacterium]|nr:hypothetical protein [Acidimicrobiia bacterium]MCY4456535.1 hypothetical protein [Acidimicrobiaceae bacterium]